ncbi:MULTISPECIES: hypothetical protein [unclassified Aeromicrobium]|uniref:hypothetical protein n=1 Tax=unclassified Aeromicrobium TaxID=2633570 RepID=UPI0028894F1D|nr:MULTISPECIES: hypothetical protein [unclassified Aeromicrobium]
MHPYTALVTALGFEHYITLGGILAPLVTAVCTLLLGWYLDQRSKRTEAAAQLAAARSKPTGNGFAQEVRAALGRIERGQLDHGDRLTRLEDAVLTPRKD